MKAKKHIIKISEIANSNRNAKVLGFGCPAMTEGQTICYSECILREREIYFHCSNACIGNPEIFYDNYYFWEDEADHEEHIA